MGLLAIPQERIAQRLGIDQQLVGYHLQKTSELKNFVNAQLERGFFVNTIAEKLGWDRTTIKEDLAGCKNGKSAENTKSLTSTLRAGLKLKSEGNY